MLTATAAVFTLLQDAVVRSPQWNDAADLHQRARVSADALRRVVGGAGASVPHLAGRAAFPALEPRRRSSFLVTASAIAVRSVPDGAAWAPISAPLAPGAATASVDWHPGCASGTVCGFTSESDAVVLDGAGGWHLLSIESLAPATLGIVDRVPGRTATFEAGATIAEAEEVSLYFDTGSGALRQEGPGEGDFPVVDGLSALRFEYFTEGLAPLSLSSLSDGPLCGSGSLAYDCDVLRIRAVRARFTVASPRAGVAPLSLVVDVTPRNLQR
jgi:hypothetical protein